MGGDTVKRPSPTINQAASIMGVSPQFLRVALQQGKFPFGVAVKMKRWAYFINPDKFDDYLQDGKLRAIR